MPSLMVIFMRVFMQQPPSFVSSTYPHYIYLIHKSVYGLKHTPHAWFAKLSSSLLSFSFTCNQADNSLFIYHTSTHLILLLIYVDDVVLIDNDLSFISHLTTWLNNEFSLKDLGNLHYFLSIEVKNFSQRLLLTQTKYAHDLLVKTHMPDATKTNSLITYKPSPLPSDDHPSNHTIYLQLYGSLQYLTFTHPDLTNVVNLTCQQFQNPTMKDLQ